MTLLDLTRELFTYLVVFRQRAVSAAPPSLETVNEDLEAIFLAMEEQAREHPLLGGPYQQVRYGLTVLCDEVLLTSAWPQAQSWAWEPLEQRLYGSRQGGTRFFQVLKEQAGAPRDVLAIYYLCLGLGFCGCYAADDPHLEQIKAGLLERLRAPLKPPPEPAPPPRRPLAASPAPAAQPEPLPKSAAPPMPALALEPQAEPVQVLTPPPGVSPVAPVAEPPLAASAQEPRGSTKSPARPSMQPTPPSRRAGRGWRAVAVALGSMGLAGVLLWLSLGPWREGPPPVVARLGHKAVAPLPVVEVSPAPAPVAEPAAPPPTVEAPNVPESMPAPAVDPVKTTEPTPPAPPSEIAKAPEPVQPPPAPEPAKAPEPAPPSPVVEMAKASEPAAPPPTVEAPKVPEPAAPTPPPARGMAQAPAPAPMAAEAPKPAESPPPPPPVPQAEPGVYILHAGLYVGPIQSGRLAQRLKSAGLPAHVRQEVRGEGKVRYLVLVGPYQQEAQAQQAAENIERRFGIKPFFLEPSATPAVPLREPSGSNGSR